MIEAAPRGIQIVTGARWSAELGNRWPAAAELLIELLDDPKLQTDIAVIDVGNHPGRATERLCRAADAVVVVTTCETAAVISTFEAIKSLSRDMAQPGAAVPQALHLLVNMARSARDAESVRRRLGRACRRMLGIELLGMDLLGLSQKAGRVGIAHKNGESRGGQCPSYINLRTTGRTNRLF